MRTGKASGASIRVGEPYESSKSEEIRLFFKDAKTFVVTGEGPRGPLYAVYALLGEAEAAAKGEKRTLDQVRKIRFSVRHAMLVRYCYDLAAAAAKKGVAILASR